MSEQEQNQNTNQSTQESNNQATNQVDTSQYSADNPQPLNMGDNNDMNARIQQLVSEGIENKVSGLKNTNISLKEEKTALSKENAEFKQLIEAIGGKEKLAKYAEEQEKLKETELGQLLVDGKYDDWFAHKYQERETTHKNQIDDLLSRNQKLESQLSEQAQKVLNDSLQRAIAEAGQLEACKVRSPGASKDAYRYAVESKELSWDEEIKQFVYRKAGVVQFEEDGKTPKGVKGWMLDQMKYNDDASHWFGASSGSGAGGNEYSSGAITSGNPQAMLAEYAKQGGDDYDKLRDQLFGVTQNN